MDPRCILPLLALPTLLIPSGCRRDPEPGLAKRVILITCDTLRADRLGVYGYARDVSPNLDNFAQRSTVFDHAYSSTAITGPALSALFTGRLPDELGVSASNQMLIPSEATTLTEILQAQGVPTAAFVSNWVLRRRQGDVGVQQGFDHYDDTMTETEENREGVHERVASDTTDAALEWLTDNQGERFFLWIHYQDPHGPYTPPAAFVDELDRPLGSEPLLEVGATQADAGRLPPYQVLGDERHPEYYRIRYDAEIRYFDHEVGRLFDMLEANAMLLDSLIIFTADHGESLGDHGWWFLHGHHLFRDAVHVPFIVHYPMGVMRPEPAYASDGVAHVGSVVSHQDVWPTVFEAFGMAVPPSRGRNLFTRTLDPEHVVTHHLRAPGSRARWEGISSERYHLVLPPGGRSLLFDLQEDPLESVDLSRSDKGRVEELLERRRVSLEGLPALRLRGVDDALDAVELDAMEDLGYGGGADD